MKARISRLVEGHRNIAFYYTSVLVRRRRNRITTMKNRMGNWIHGDSKIANHIRNGFLELFSTSHCSSQLAEWTPPFWQAGLHKADVAHLEGPLTNAEIWSALWSLKPYKAPGPDGLHAGFFQRFWHTVGNSIREAMKLIFSLGEMPAYLNKTLITLIPK